VCLVLIVFGVYRLATFVPQPLDSATTLRPVLYAWFSAFLRHFERPEQALSNWKLLCLVALLIPPALGLFNYFSRRPVRVLCSRTLFFLSIAASLAIARYPVLLAGELNVDETQFIASACKLFKDPVFFRSVDCGTSGPVNIFPLMLPAMAGVSPDYASSRVVGLVIIVLTIFVLYRAFALIAADGVARLAVLPAAGFFAILKNNDFVHYSSEHVSLLLVALSLYCCLFVLRHPQRYAVPLFGLGLLTTAAFFAKMQSVPIVAAPAAVAVGYVYASGAARRLWRPVLILAAGAAPLPIINAAICAATGVWKNFWVTYVLANRGYGAAMAVPDIRQFLAYLVVTSEMRYSLLGFSAVLAARFLFYRKHGGEAAPVLRWVGLLAMALLGAALLAVYVPHRLYPHYQLLLIVPLCMTVAWSILSRDKKASLFVILIAGCQAYLVTFPGSAVGNFGSIVPYEIFMYVPPAVRPPESVFIDSLTQPDEEIVVWGWNAQTYLGSGRTPATRDTNMANFFPPVAPELTAYYRQRFLDDLRQHPAAMFIDANGPHGTCCGFDHKFEEVPEIASYVGSNYVHVIDAYSQRFFIRRDLAYRAGAREP
jgi:hypothetical protein